MSVGLTKRYRHLPHWQQDGSTYHVIFRTKIGELPDKAKVNIVATVQEYSEKLYYIQFGVVMPNHVHLLIKPVQKANGMFYSIAEIAKRIKGKTAHAINLMSGSTGSIWLQEYYDHIIRNQDDYEKQAMYIYLNPVRKGLVENPDEYPYFITP